MQSQHYLIHTRKYQLQISFQPARKVILFIFISKINNYPFIIYVGSLPYNLIGEDPQSVLKKVSKYRNISINPQIPSITLLMEKGVSLILIQKHLSEKDNIMQHLNKRVHFNINYWHWKEKKLEVEGVSDPYKEKIFLQVLEKNPDKIKKVSRASISNKSENYLSQESLSNLFQNLEKISLNNQMLNFYEQPSKKIPLDAHHVISKPDEEPSFKLELFRQIFLTELIASIIINQFGRSKLKKETNSFLGYGYEDEGLEELRSCGHRLSEFRDHPFKKQGRKKGEENLQKSDFRKEKNNKCDSRVGFGSPLQTIGQKIQRKGQVCNFTLITGKQKSKINKKRYCLYQMTRETDKTEALINFVQLIFQTYPKAELIRHDKCWKWLQKCGQVQYFMGNFKVKRDIASCFMIYTRQSFFFKTLNSGLRILHDPSEMAYLRIAFSHMFWSIKLVYQRHKRVICKNEKKNRAIVLFRGADIREQQIKKLGKNIDGYIEAEGFLSTSLSVDSCDMFMINTKIVIEIPQKNLNSTFDNGFASISYFSNHPNERQVLVNAFNVFKIIAISSSFDELKGMMINTVYLEYGSIKSIEDKMSKSQRLLEGEYKLKQDKMNIQNIKLKLEVLKEKMTKKELSRLSALLLVEEQKLEKRKKKLKKQEEEEYTWLEQKLSQWGKQIIRSTKHQQKAISEIENYGQLLYSLGEYRLACAYEEKQVKHLELGKAVEGQNWRKCISLIHKQSIHRKNLSSCYNMLGRLADSLIQMKKLFQLYSHLGIEKQNPLYYELLFEMYQISSLIFGHESERIKYKKQLLSILTSQNQKKYFGYKKIQEIENLLEPQKLKKLKEGKKQIERQKQQKKEIKWTIKNRRRQIQQKYKQLKDMKKYWEGKYSTKYLETLCGLIKLLWIQKQWRPAIKLSTKYFSIRSAISQIEHRLQTCAVFQYSFCSCVELKSKSSLKTLCESLEQFISLPIYNYSQVDVMWRCIWACLKLKSFRAGKSPLLKFIKVKIKCKIKYHHLFNIIFFGYVLLSMSLCEVQDVQRFLQQAKNLHKYQEQKDIQKQIMLRHIFDYNDTFSESRDSLWAERNKDFEDSQIIKYAYQIINEEKSWWQIFKWESSKAELIPWQSPFHLLQINQLYVSYGIRGEYLAKSNPTMLFIYFKLYLKLGNNIMNRSQTQQYLRMLSTAKKLHLNPFFFVNLRSLLEFRNQIDVLLKRIDADLIQAVQNETNLQEKFSDQQINKLKLRLKNRFCIQEMESSIEKYQISRLQHRYTNFLQSSGLRKRKILKSYQKNQKTKR